MEYITFDNFGRIVAVWLAFCFCWSILKAVHNVVTMTKFMKNHSDNWSVKHSVEMLANECDEIVILNKETKEEFKWNKW